MGGAVGGAGRMDDVDFRILFEGSPDILLVLLPDAPRYTMVAATQSRYVATHTSPETLGRGLFELFPDNPDDPSATGTANLRASLDRVLATRAPDTMAVQKYDIRGPDGTFQTKYWSPKNLPVLSPSGEVLYVLHRVEDVTDLVRASELGEELRGQTRAMEREVLARSQELAVAVRELRDANTRLGELDAAKTAFFSNVSHEFRTPLTLMLGPIEDALADASEPLGKAQRKRIHLAHDNSLRLLKLVNGLLDFSRIEAGRVHATYAPLDIGQFTAELAGMFQSAVGKSGLRLTVDCPRLSEPAWVDREMWEKIVPNLVSNAFKFTLAGEIAVRMREDDARFVLEIADTGVGIPQAELPKIFDRFHRVPNAPGRTHEGTGIGLSLVRELVNLHGGDVTVESTVGKGTTFRVNIPKGREHLAADRISVDPIGPQGSRDAVAHAAEAARWVGGTSTAVEEPPAAGAAFSPQEEPTRPRTLPPPAPAGPGRPRILVVDDNADLREYIASLLAVEYDVAKAPDGVLALESARAIKPDLVVSDVMMPHLDGFGLVREMRKDARTASVPIILLSARAGEESAIEGLDVGSDDYLVKPFSARELLARVRTHLALARARLQWIAELERTNRELDAFSYSVSHDLRAPVRAISGFAAALQDDHTGALDPKGREYVERIRRGAVRMNGLIDDLLGLARISRVALSADMVDITALAQSVVTDLRASQPERAVTVNVESGLTVRGDGHLLRIVLVNLIGNAWKYSSRRPDARIEVGRLAGQDPTFFVRDNGAGFDMAYAQHLFAPFQRLHSAQEFDGTGVGLATVQRIVSRHGGRIWADATIGAGAVFFFTVPGPALSRLP